MKRYMPPTDSEPRVGDVLLSEPFLDDAYFGRKAVLICEHNEEGTFGFVLNNFIALDLNDLMDGLPEIEARISVGGPVKSSSLYYLHSRPEMIEGSIEVVDGVCMGGDFESVVRLLKDGVLSADEIRFFIGYAGWSGSQLQDEIQSRSWFVTRTNRTVIMDTSLPEEDIWKHLVSSLGDDYAHVANTPPDPSVN
jgi:putative transcriptional regulator